MVLFKAFIITFEMMSDWHNISGFNELYRTSFLGMIGISPSLAIIPKSLWASIGEHATGVGKERSLH